MDESFHVNYVDFFTNGAVFLIGAGMFALGMIVLFVLYAWLRD